jgi:hypothetical protein
MNLPQRNQKTLRNPPKGNSLLVRKIEIILPRPPILMETTYQNLNNVEALDRGVSVMEKSLKKVGRKQLYCILLTEKNSKADAK